ncbi:mitochondrial chaperone BCS1 [Microdochium nivale]|nr:mitochondrial chaperone BCS1 [Microdochium nivale]
MTRLFHAGGAAAGSAAFPGMQDGGVALLRDLLSGNFSLDITRVSAALTILSFGLGAIRYGAVLARRCVYWVQQFFTACVTVTAPDELHEQVLRWLSENVLKQQKTRLLCAKSNRAPQGGSMRPHPPLGLVRATRAHRRAASIEYLPAYGTTWFFQERTLFAVTRSAKSSGGAALPGLDLGLSSMVVSTSGKGEEMLSIMCLGRSAEPIKNFLERCRSFNRKLKNFSVTVRSAGERGSSWELSCQKAIRPLETLYLDDAVKQDIVDDMRRYLNTATAEYYQRRGIPYRRGYLLYGPPGTGKTSLSLALAGAFKLDLYVLNMPNVASDSALGSMFNALPARCIVLLEDIDVIGMKRQAVSEGSSNDQSDSDDDIDGSWTLGRGHPPISISPPRVSRAGCTLSGLLNVLDGVASQEGRIVLMTSNDPESLDAALLRPGRVDRKYHLGYMNRSAVAAMFRCMFEPEPPLHVGKPGAPGEEQDLGQTSTLQDDMAGPSNIESSVAANSISNGVDKKTSENEDGNEAAEQTLEQQALEFAALVPEGSFTPAKLQGYLLMHRESPIAALGGLPTWIETEAREARRAEKKAAAAAAAAARASKAL